VLIPISRANIDEVVIYKKVNIIECKKYLHEERKWPRKLDRRIAGDKGEK
jgi:hypothetical protein